MGGTGLPYTRLAHQHDQSASAGHGVSERRLQHRHLLLAADENMGCVASGAGTLPCL